MDAVLLLWCAHEFEDGDEDKLLIGVYRSEGDAKTAVERLVSSQDLLTLRTDFRFPVTS